MRISKLSALILAAAGTLFLGATAAHAQDRYYDRQDLHGDYRDIHGDYARLDQLRADIASDQYRLNQARYSGDRWAAHQIARDLDRDRHAYRALAHDIKHDRRDIRHDQRDLDRDGDRH